MLLLYYGSGSREVQLAEQHNPTVWSLVKKNAVRYLRLKHEIDAADTLENTPFELWDGTNGFNDEFELLYLRTPLGHYLQLRVEAHTDLSHWRYRQIADALSEMNNPIRFIAVDPLTEETNGVAMPELKITSAVVERALSDFETLAQSKGGHVSSIDRIHTALHGYLAEVCREAGIQHDDSAGITTLFKLIRLQHPKLQNSPPGEEAQRIVLALATIVDTLNPVRNWKSMAHPNEELLGEAEAMLAANAVRSLLHYLNSKLQ
ncbi:MAG: abortive infection family protein [Acidobacteriia bacterium]|nr:abortive infection family protein [Terriglobia bacterium]